MRLVGVCARLVSAESVLPASGQGDTELRLQKAQGDEPLSLQYLYFTDEDFKTLAEREFRDDGRKVGAKAEGGGIPPRANANQHHDMYSIEEYTMAGDVEVHGIGVENLQGSGKIGSETSCARDDEMFTIGYATPTQFQLGDDNQAAWFFVFFLAFIYISSRRKDIIPTEKLLKKRREIIGRAENMRLIPSNTYAKFRALKVLSAGLFILAGSVDANLDINSPLKRPCIWEWEKESLTVEQQTCLSEKMRTSKPGILHVAKSKQFVDYVQTGGWHDTKQILSTNPTEIPGISILKALEILMTKYCGEDTGSVALSAIPGYGIAKKVFKAILPALVKKKLIKAVHTVSKALSSAPKIGPVADKIKKFFKPIRKTKENAEDELEEKCEKSKVFRFILYEVYPKYAKFKKLVWVFDNAMIWPLSNQVCDATNAHVQCLLRDCNAEIDNPLARVRRVELSPNNDDVEKSLKRRLRPSKRQWKPSLYP
jgi:hypothetical protein